MIREGNIEGILDKRVVKEVNMSAKLEMFL